MLYIYVPMDKIIELGENILNNFPKVLENGNEILIHKHCSVPNLSGEIDFWRDKALFDIKLSHEENANLNWVMQLMAYKGMLNIDVDRFIIYNVLQGKIIEIPIVDEERCKKLVKFLSNLKK